MSDQPTTTPASPTTSDHGVPTLPHDFDGIQELDHDTPWWFHLLFFGTVFWSIAYLLHYHAGPGLMGDARWKAEDAAVQELRVKNATGPLSEEQLRGLLTSTERIAKGREVYIQAGCATCHGGDGTGTVGPNLFDKHWLYGNTMTELQDVVAKGRAAGKMPAHDGKLSQDQITNVTIWIIDGLRKGPKPGKAPEAREKELETY